MATTKSKKVNKERQRDQFTVVLEKINSKIDLLVDAHKGTDERMDRFENKMNNFENKMNNFENKMNNFENRMDKFENRMDNMERGMRLTLDYLSRIENELHGETATKVGIREFAVLEKRVSKLEKQRAK